MWFDEAVIYQIYPLGLCGAPRDNDGVQAPRILRVLDWIEHIKSTSADTVVLLSFIRSAIWVRLTPGISSIIW